MTQILFSCRLVTIWNAARYSRWNCCKVDHHVGMWTHNYYRDWRPGAGVLCSSTALGKALEDVKSELGEQFLVQDRHCATHTNCDGQPTAVQPCSRAAAAVMVPVWFDLFKMR